MPDVLQWGPFLIRVDWLYYGISLFLGLTIARRVTKRKSPSDLQNIDLFFNAFLVGIIIWKASPIFSEPQLLKSPLSLLSYPGTSLGIIAAYIGATVYLAYTVWKRKINWRSMLDMFSVLLISTVFVYSLTHWQYGVQTTAPWGISISDPQYRYHPINLYQLLVLIPVCLRLLRLPIGKGEMASTGFIGYGLSLLVSALLKPKISTFFQLSTDQWIAIGFIAIGSIVMMMNQKRGELLGREAKE